MKLSSPPTRYAFTSVIAAAMKYGPTRVSRIAYELDMPVETCRYYLKRFHNAGFRFVIAVDYKALGLQPCILFVRFSRKFDPSKRENFLRWLDTVYTVYRAGLENELEYYMEAVPPQGDVKTFKNLVETMIEAEVLDNYNLYEINNGYYKPNWLKSYDFTRDCWGEELEIDIPKIPLSQRETATNFDLTDLSILSYLERNPAIKMYEISQKLAISPQLASYHREKHVEGGRLITGYIPSRATKHQDVQIKLFMQYRKEHKDDIMQYLHRVTFTEYYALLRLHTPVGTELDVGDTTSFSIDPMSLTRFTIPVEHFLEKKWVKIETFIESLEKMIRVA